MDFSKTPKRDIGRRKEDHIVREQNVRFHRLCEVGKTITAEIDINVLFQLVMEQTNQIMQTERSTVFLHDSGTDELWSLVATGMKNKEIRIPADAGVAGWVYRNEDSLLTNDAYREPRFNTAVDKKTGFRTRNILCVPLFNSEKKCIGVLQTLNKRDGDFSEADNTFLLAIADYVGIALENAKLYDDVRTYSKSLQDQIIINESLVQLKNQLAKFVPPTVADLAESDPETLSGGKVPMDVSVLFVDLHNFSRITEENDQRAVNHMVENHFSNYIRCIHQNGGEINETAGDGIMVIFKSDTIENFASRAVRTALEIARENERINKKYKYPFGDVGLHIGLSSGEAYVGTTRMKSSLVDRWTYTASGLVTILAARIASVPEINKVLIGPDTYERIQDDFACELLGDFELKNVSRKVPIYRVIKEKVYTPTY